MDPATAVVAGSGVVALGLLVYSHVTVHAWGAAEAAGDLRAAAAELREEQAARKRADALAEERLRRVVELEARGAEWSARATADAAKVGAIDAALPPGAGGPAVDLGAALDGLLPSTAAGAGGPDRGPAAPAGPGPGASPPA